MVPWKVELKCDMYIGPVKRAVRPHIRSGSCINIVNSPFLRDIHSIVS